MTEQGAETVPEPVDCGVCGGTGQIECDCIWCSEDDHGTTCDACGGTGEAPQ